MSMFTLIIYWHELIDTSQMATALSIIEEINENQDAIIAAKLEKEKVKQEIMEQRKQKREEKKKKKQELLKQAAQMYIAKKKQVRSARLPLLLT